MSVCGGDAHLTVSDMITRLLTPIYCIRYGQRDPRAGDGGRGGGGGALGRHKSCEDYIRRWLQYSPICGHPQATLKKSCIRSSGEVSLLLQNGIFFSFCHIFHYFLNTNPPPPPPRKKENFAAARLATISDTRWTGNKLLRVASVFPYMWPPSVFLYMWPPSPEATFYLIEEKSLQ